MNWSAWKFDCIGFCGDCKPFFWAKLRGEFEHGDVVVDDDVDEDDEQFVDDEDKFCMENSIDFGCGLSSSLGLNLLIGLSGLKFFAFGKQSIISESNFRLRIIFDSMSELDGDSESVRLILSEYFDSEFGDEHFLFMFDGNTFDDIFWCFFKLFFSFNIATIGHPDTLRCELRLLFTWPLPWHPGVGHLSITSWLWTLKKLKKYFKMLTWVKKKKKTYFVKQCFCLFLDIQKEICDANKDQLRDQCHHIQQMGTLNP